MLAPQKRGSLQVPVGHNAIELAQVSEDESDVGEDGLDDEEFERRQKKAANSKYCRTPSPNPSSVVSRRSSDRRLSNVSELSVYSGRPSNLPSHVTSGKRMSDVSLCSFSPRSRLLTDESLIYFMPQAERDSRWGPHQMPLCGSLPLSQSRRSSESTDSCRCRYGTGSDSTDSYRRGSFVPVMSTVSSSDGQISATPTLLHEVSSSSYGGPMSSTPTTATVIQQQSSSSYGGPTSSTPTIATVVQQQSSSSYGGYGPVSSFGSMASGYGVPTSSTHGMTNSYSGPPARSSYMAVPATGYVAPPTTRVMAPPPGHFNAYSSSASSSSAMTFPIPEEVIQVSATVARTVARDSFGDSFGAVISDSAPAGTVARTAARDSFGDSFGAVTSDSAPAGNQRDRVSSLAQQSDRSLALPTAKASSRRPSASSTMSGVESQSTGLSSCSMSSRAAAPEVADSRSRTSVMLKNLPEAFGRDSVVNLLNSHGFEKQVDFVYVPMNFKDQSIVTCFGYAFVHFISAEAANKCHMVLEGFCDWDSTRTCTVVWSETDQGLQAHVDRYHNSPVMHASVSDEYKPAIYRDGLRIQFPPPTKNIRPPRVRKAAAA